jgi:hypothetical protein
MGAKAWLIASGVISILLGVFVRWRSARYDLKDAAIDSAWTLIRRKRTAENPTALEAKYTEITSAPTWTGKATRAAGTAAGHFVAQVLAVVALVLVVGGMALIAGGMMWA